MGRVGTAVLMAAVAFGLAAPSAPGARAGTGTFTRYTDQGLPYWMYVPSTYTGASAVPLVVYLQGCNQSVPDAALGSRWNAVAEQQGFIVAYPEQQVGLYPAQTGNVSRCWNFASPLEWSRTGFEASSIAAITRHASSTWNIDPKKVFVTGISAGGAQASLMAALFPDLYSAAGILLGCSFPCGDATGTGAYNAMGTYKRPMPIMTVAGVGDPAISVPVAQDTLEQWIATNDFIDDGLENGSVSPAPAAVENYGFSQTPQPGSGDPCVNPSGPTKLPCAGGIVGFQGTYPYTIRRFNDAAHKELIDAWDIYGLSHAYPGGDPSASFTDPLGPDVTTALYNFFMAHPR